MKNLNEKGFTLIELLVVIAIIAVLSLAVFSSINPKKRIQQSRDTNRTADVGSIISAIYMYINENNGALPTGLTLNMAERQLGTSNGSGGSNPSCAISTGTCNVVNTACLDLTTPLNRYLASIPIDPLKTTFSASNTGYSVAVNTNGIVTVKACGAEQASSISISR
jgi:prepilin-type N-terminal cleavage/methylation domain-containing protein